jgi:energy-coupling factor transport system permease protein
VLNRVESQLIISVFIAFTIALSGIPVSFFLKTFKYLWLFILLIWVFQLFESEGAILFRIGSLRVTVESINSATSLSFKIINSFILSILFSSTVTPLQLSETVESTLLFFHFKKSTAQEFSLVFTIALKFLPILYTEADHLIKAQKSKGAAIDYDSIFVRIRALQRVFLPLLINTIKRATELSIALEARGYASGHSRSKYRRSVFRFSDGIFLAGVFLLCSTLIFCERF